MDEKTSELIEKLANKLGTTAEHLWGVLIHQAPIDAACNVFGIICLAFASIFFGKKAWALSKERSYDNEGAQIITTLIALVCGALTAAFILADLSEIISGFFNPEYWALKQIIK